MHKTDVKIDSTFWMDGKGQLWWCIHSSSEMFYILDSGCYCTVNCNSRYERCWVSAPWSVGHYHKFLERHSSVWIALPFSKKKKKTKAPKPSNPNFATERSKVMIGRYPPGDSSVSHPQPNLHYSTVDLPLHPRGCLLRACEAQWTEFQWVDSFFCLSVRTLRVRRLASTLHEYTVTAWHKQKCWGASFSPLVFLLLTLVFHSLSTASLSLLCFPSLGPLFLFLSFPLCGLFSLFCHPLHFTKKKAVHQSDDWSALVNVVITGTRQA